jgi:hypothetical protein
MMIVLKHYCQNHLLLIHKSPAGVRLLPYYKELPVIDNPMIDAIALYYKSQNILSGFYINSTLPHKRSDRYSHTIPRMNVYNSAQVYKAFTHGNISNVNLPNLIAPFNH